MEFDRSKSLGGSDVAAIMNLSKYRSGNHVAADKRGEPLEVVDPGENRFIYWGLRLESLLLDVYAEKVGLKTPTGRMKRKHSVVVPEPRHHESESWAHASPDGIVTTPSGSWGVEIKTASEYVKTDWGPEGTDQIPDYYMTQCLWYMWIFDLTRWDLAVLIGGNDFRVYTIERNEKVEENINLLIVRARNWWTNHIVNGHPVPVEGTEADAKALAIMFPDGCDESVDAPDNVLGWVKQYNEGRVEMRELKKRQASLRTLITGYMGDANVLECGDAGFVSFKAPKPSMKIDWKSVVMRLHEMYRADAGDDISIDPVIEDNTTYEKNARRLDVSKITNKGESDE